MNALVRASTDTLRSQELVASASATSEETLRVISDYYSTSKFVFDPHTAVGVCALHKLRSV